MLRRLTKAVCGLGLAMVLAGVPIGFAAAADPLWLDLPLQGWNHPGGVPPAPSRPNPVPIPACSQQERGPANEPEKQVTAAGWRLESYWPSRQADDVTVVMATAAYDGMCRPLAYQALAFVGERFTGTLSPTLMNSREDGALSEAPTVRQGAVIEARFIRYAATDPLCCPSLGHTAVRYELASVGGGSVFIPTAVTRIPPAATSPAPEAPPARPVPSALPNTGDLLGWPAAVAWLATGLAGVTAGRRLRRTV